MFSGSNTCIWCYEKLNNLELAIKEGPHLQHNIQSIHSDKKNFKISSHMCAAPTLNCYFLQIS